MKTIFPEEQNIKNPDRSILTIYTGEEHFSLSLYDPEKQGSFLYREISGEDQIDAFATFKEMFFNNSFLSLPFRKVWIMNRTPNFTFVPDSFYKDEYKEDFIQFLFSNQQGITLTDSVPSVGIKVLYQLPENLYRFMLRSFAKPKFVHFSTPLISYFIKNSKNVDARQMVVNLQEDGLDIFCFSKETFLIGNYFPCKGTQDALYYILFTWKQLKLNQLDDYLHITGNNAFKEELIDKLTLYFQQILFPDIATENCFEGIETDRIPFELAALSVCE